MGVGVVPPIVEVRGVAAAVGRVCGKPQFVAAVGGHDVIAVDVGQQVRLGRSCGGDGEVEGSPVWAS